MEPSPRRKLPQMARPNGDKRHRGMQADASATAVLSSDADGRTAEKLATACIAPVRLRGGGGARDHDPPSDGRQQRPLPPPPPRCTSPAKPLQASPNTAPVTEAEPFEQQQQQQQQQQPPPLLGTPAVPLPRSQGIQQQHQQLPPTPGAPEAPRRPPHPQVTQQPQLAAANAPDGAAGDGRQPQLRDIPGPTVFDRTEREVRAEAVGDASWPAILNVRCPLPPPQQLPGSSQPSKQHNVVRSSRPPAPGPVVRVLVPSETTVRELGRYIVQATGVGITPATGGGTFLAGMGEVPAPEPPLAGLFREANAMFIPLSYVLATAKDLEREVLSLTRPLPLPRAPKPPPPQWPNFVAALVALIAIGIFVDLEKLMYDLFSYAERAVFLLLGLPALLAGVLIDLPLQELYRNGPSFLGWEGMPLSRVCAQVTYHGDEMFWSRNVAECERIYAAKEAAALHVARPVVYLAAAVAIFSAIRSLVRTNAIRNRYKPDRNMTELYNAFYAIMRQMQRAGGVSPQPARR